MAGSVILAGARTPIGKLSGALAGFSAAELGGLAIKEALARAGLTGDQIDYVFMGQVLQAGAGQIAARQAASHGGIPMTVPATTINKVCLSGLNSIYLADKMIQDGDADIVVAGGMESMTQAPYLLPGARAGYRIGDQKVVDSMMYDGLFCAFDQVAMGAGTEKYAASAGLAREPQDELAAKSHERAARAAKDGLFDNEIVKVEIPQRKGDPIVFDTDEGVRGETTAESLAGLRPAFDKAGNITAGNASQISDGGAAVIVASKAAAEKLGVTPLGEVVGYGQVAGPDPSLLTQPARAIKAAAERSGRVGERHLAVRAQRGLRGRRTGLDDGPRHHRRHRQRERRRHRPRPSRRHVRHARGAHPPARAGPSRRWPRCRRPVRRRRPGRRHPPPGLTQLRHQAPTPPTRPATVPRPYGSRGVAGCHAVPTPGRPATTDDRQERVLSQAASAAPVDRPPRRG